ncbi:ABC transporter ATP-binding protein [Apilactobacillus xinyiensis]|uniref:ATP-binding cassette domain-containing protein n=1 Tax=Apilactobacillus xinyiensis TaxID=2841032 RepID=A0ABT0I2E2_9LACO|nr:ATP-binding cassette domain-containing protein [Apilactobacillus xinyiensis]MCK8624881.1 ATP-binding cassette domain-containing protein [Apilactobacillus xinyiensis]
MIEFKNVSKNFGNFNAVSNLSFKLNKGEILSLIGQNGAGKSTTFHMLLDFIKPTKGQIIWNKNLKRNIGYMPEERGLYPKESIKNQILYFAALHGMHKSKAYVELKKWMNKLNVVGEPNDHIESLSKGNAQKVQLIACLMFSPELLILDEPFSGLDPVNADLLIKAILEAKNNGTMIIFSTHNMENVEKLSDYIIMLSHGKTVLKGDIHSIYKQFGRTRLSIEGYKNIKLLEDFPGIKNIDFYNDDCANMELENENVGKTLFNKISEDGYVPVFDQHYPSLDSIFKLKAK